MKLGSAGFWSSISASLLVFASVMVVGVGSSVVSGCTVSGDVDVNLNDGYCPNRDSAWAAQDSIPKSCCPVDSAAWANTHYAPVSCCVYYPLGCGTGSSNPSIMRAIAGNQWLFFERTGNPSVFKRVSDNEAMHRRLSEYVFLKLNTP